MWFRHDGSLEPFPNVYTCHPELQPGKACKVPEAAKTLEEACCLLLSLGCSISTFVGFYWSCGNKKSVGVLKDAFDFLSRSRNLSTCKPRAVGEL